MVLPASPDWTLRVISTEKLRDAREPDIRGPGWHRDAPITSARHEHARPMADDKRIIFPYEGGKTCLPGRASSRISTSPLLRPH